MSNNSLSGTIPRSIDSLRALRYLILSSNNLSGELPSLRNCTNMKSLDLGENKFSGNIPAWIGENMLSLLILRLSSNSFTASIPSQLCDLSNLHILDLSHNNLAGHIPPCVGNLSGFKVSVISDKDTSYLYQGKLKAVTKGRVQDFGSTLYLVNSLDLSNNYLSGEIPMELTTLINLWTLNLSMNHLTGIIPSRIGNMESIETLDLSINQLSGSIPQSMVSLTFLNHLNLSYNNLSGNVPTGNQFNSLVDPSVYEGNAALCGFPLPDCQDNGETPQVPSGGGKEFEWLGFVISAVIGFIVGFWGVCGSLVINKSWRQAYFHFIDRMKYALIDFVSAIGKHLQKISKGTKES
ncbi:hypothetical protein M0R45_026077 [Rubus argutus]